MYHFFCKLPGYDFVCLYCWTPYLPRTWSGLQSMHVLNSTAWHKILTRWAATRHGSQAELYIDILIKDRWLLRCNSEPLGAESPPASDRFCHIWRSSSCLVQKSFTMALSRTAKLIQFINYRTRLQRCKHAANGRTLRSLY